MKPVDLLTYVAHKLQNVIFSMYTYLYYRISVNHSSKTYLKIYTYLLLLKIKKKKLEDLSE